MSRTVTAMFDTKHDAEAGRERLLASSVDADNVRIHDQSSSGGTGGQYSTHQDRGMWDSIKNAFLPDEDRHTYEEGVRRGGFLLTADVDEHQADEAVRALEEANSVDIDERSQSWRQQGWDYQPQASQPGTERGAFGAMGDRDTDRDTDRMTTSGDDERIPVIEEQLIVGKREVERGGVRVRSYVSEVPVHEQVRLREERVRVERVPVDRELTDGDTDAFRERSIEMTETSEEAVVGKKARVVEEVLVHKDSNERVEEIDDTVRHTDVDVEQTGGETRTDYERTETGTTGTGTTGGGFAGSTGGTGGTSGSAPKGLFGTSGQGTGMGGSGTGGVGTSGRDDESKSGY